MSVLWTIFEWFFPIILHGVTILVWRQTVMSILTACSVHVQYCVDVCGIWVCIFTVSYLFIEIPFFWAKQCSHWMDRCSTCGIWLYSNGWGALISCKLQCNGIMGHYQNEISNMYTRYRVLWLKCFVNSILVSA